MNPIPFIVSEPGHAGHGDPGAVANGIIESDWNIFSAIRFEDRLDGYLCDCQVFQPPGLDANEDLRQSVQFAIKNKAALYLSFHINKFSDPAVSGFRSYRYPDSSAENARIHGVIHQAAAKYCTAKGMKDGKQQTANFYVLRETNKAGIPAVLFEIGFMSNPGDAARLKDLKFLDGLANEIAWGAVQALGLKSRQAVECANCAELKKAQQEYRTAKQVLSDISIKAAPYLIK